MNTNIMTERPTKPWFRQFWPWALMSGPAAVVIAGAVTMIVASRTPESMVVDDYYRQGKAINLSLHRDDVARSLGLRAHLIVLESGAVSLSIHDRNDMPIALDAVKLSLIHPSNGDQDLKVVLQRVQLENGAVEYQEHLGVLPNKHWGILLEDPQAQWRLTSANRASLPGEVDLEPQPAPAE
jgi:hypothetical protein